MSFVQKLAGYGKCVFMLVVSLGILTGCGSFDSTHQKKASVQQPPRVNLRIDDEVSVLFGGVPNPPDRYVGRIKEDGTITLPLVGSVKAAGKAVGEFEKEIHDLYVPKYYQLLNVTVNVANLWFHVDGYVKNPNRMPYAGEMTVLKAIAAAGGCSEFANRKKVKLNRSTGETLIVNYDKALRNPGLDLPVYPGDYIYVPRRLF